MPHGAEIRPVLTNYETKGYTIYKYSTVIWPCNANRNEHAGNERPPRLESSR